MTPTSRVETITPQTAEDILAAKHPNRPVRQWKVDQYANDLAAGRWVLNGTAIGICAEHGGETDGRHRLLAIVKTRKPMTTFVVRGLTCEIQDTIDGAAARTPGNSFHHAGYGASNDVAAATRIAAALRCPSMPARLAMLMPSMATGIMMAISSSDTKANVTHSGMPKMRG